MERESSAPPPRTSPEGAATELDCSGVGARRTSAWAVLVVLLSLVLHAPSLGWGDFADDHVHALALEGELEELGMHPLALYEFGDLRALSAEASEEVLVNDPRLAAFPYWTGEGWRARFLRPVASLVRWVETTAFDGSPFWAHAAGLGWWALLLVLSWRLFLVLGLAPRAALWALLFLGVENGTGLVVGWSANRNSTVEGVFLLAAVLVFLRASARGSGPGLGLAFLLAALATLAKESGVATLALFAGWCWLGRRSVAARLGAADAGRAFERGRQRWAGAAVALALVYVLAYVALGYGTESLFYPTPWGQPQAWLERAGLALTGGVVTVVTPLATDAVQVFPGSAPVFAGLGLVLAFALGSRLWPAGRAHPAGPFLAFWALVTTLPQAGAPLSDRLFLVPMVGVAGLFGLFLEATRRRASEGWASAAERWTARGLVLSAGVASGLALLAFGVQMGRVAAFSRAAVETAEVGVARSDGAELDVFVLQSPSQLVSLQPQATHTRLTGREDVRWHVLNATRRGVRWSRTGPRSFRLESLDEPFLTSLFERVFLTEELALEAGDSRTWTRPGLTVSVAAVENGHPRAVDVTLPHDLDAAQTAWLVWDGEAENGAALGLWRRIAPPPVGRSIDVPSAPAPIPLLP